MWYKKIYAGTAMLIFTRFLSLLLLVLFGCTENSPSKQYRVGVDPSWYPLELKEREQQLTAFSTELLTEIGKEEKIPFVKMTVSWDNLMLGLQKGKYEGILSSMPPYLFNQKQFAFSDVYLHLGPVLVVPKGSKIDALDQLSGKEVGVILGSGDTLLLEKIPGAMARDYDSIPKALNALSANAIDAAIIDVLSATAYCRDLYQEKLEIVTPPLNDYGLRLITPYGKSPEMVEEFNQGLKALKASKKYDELLNRWSLGN